MVKDVIIIGAGLTGLSAGVELTKRGLSVAILEKSDRTGGQIQTFHTEDFLFESGPNTGSGASQEVMELYGTLSPRCEIEFAAKEAESRWIWKKGQFHPLPNSLVTGSHSLFTFSDKLRMRGEPFRAPGTHPDETIAAMTTRRLGKSFLDYAVDPFLSGIYAGDPHTLITRHALPKLYHLEQDYGSFIGGSIKKARDAKEQPKTEARKGVFSTKGGMENLPKAMAAFIGEQNILLSVHTNTVHPDTETGLWKIHGVQNGVPLEISSKHLVTTVGSYLLPDLLPFIAAPEMRGSPTCVMHRTYRRCKREGNASIQGFRGTDPLKGAGRFPGCAVSLRLFFGQKPGRGDAFFLLYGRDEKYGSHAAVRQGD